MDSVRQAAAAVADSLPAVPGLTAPAASQGSSQGPPVERWLKADEVEVVRPDEEDKTCVSRSHSQPPPPVASRRVAALREADSQAPDRRLDEQAAAAQL